MTDTSFSLSKILGGDLADVSVHAARIVLILIAAFVLARVLRRVIHRLMTRLAERQARRLDSQLSTESQSGSQALTALREGLSGMLSPEERRERTAQRAKTLGATLASILSFIIYAVAIMLCLDELGISLAPILASAGVAGVALGFGAQSLVRDFLSGVFIIVEDQYGVGDIVDLGEASGVVEEVTLRATRVRGLDGTLWHVPNGEIRRVGNSSQYWARVILDVPVAYDVDVTRVSMLIKQVADEVWRGRAAQDIVEEPEVWGVEDFGPNSLIVRLVVKTRPGSQWDVARELRVRLKEAFDREGLEIPFPQRTVWLRERRSKGS